MSLDQTQVDRLAELKAREVPLTTDEKEEVRTLEALQTPAEKAEAVEEAKEV